MRYGGNDWLALTLEAALERELPICDPHRHFWDFRSERIPYQRYLPHELAADANCGHNVQSTVFIEDRSPTTYSINGFKRFSKSYSASERAALFHDTAIRAYRISDV